MDNTDTKLNLGPPPYRKIIGRKNDFRDHSYISFKSEEARREFEKNRFIYGEEIDPTGKTDEEIFKEMWKDYHPDYY
jgi:hypothetical protein